MASRQGGCLCGAVRYRADGPATHRTCCHCTLCRRASAAPFVPWFSVASDSFAFTRGEPVRFESSALGTRSFCGRCGTPLAFESRAHPDEVDVTTCSLDAPEALPPEDHTQAGTRLAWPSLDGLPEFARARDEPTPEEG